MKELFFCVWSTQTVYSELFINWTESVWVNNSDSDPMIQSTVRAK